MIELEFAIAMTIAAGIAGVVVGVFMCTIRLNKEPRDIYTARKVKGRKKW